MSNIPHFWKSTVCKNFIFHLIDLNKQEETKQVFCCWIEAFRSCFDSLFLWINNRGQHIIVILYCFKNLFYFFVCSHSHVGYEFILIKLHFQKLELYFWNNSNPSIINIRIISLIIAYLLKFWSRVIQLLKFSWNVDYSNFLFDLSSLEPEFKYILLKLGSAY